MRKSVFILSVLMAVLVAASSCKRRPLTDGDNNVYVEITIDKDIVNHTVTQDPALMRVMFFDHNTGRFASQAFLPAHGGYVNVLPEKTYDVLVYNFDTQSTVIGSYENYNEIFAYTNEVPTSYKNMLRSRGTKNDGELIVFEPDHLFVGTVENVYIPARSVEQPPVIIPVDAGTVVESWLLIIEEITGEEYIADITAIVAGVAHKTRLADVYDHDVSTVFIERDKPLDNGRYEAVFNTFGYHPAEEQVVTLVITDTGGQGHEFNINVSDQFIDNEKQIIYINTDQIDIPKPEPGTTGGGLAPDVDEWENINVDIII